MAFAGFERPLLAPQPTDLDDKKRKLCEISCSIFLSLQLVNPGTFSKTPCKQSGVCGPLSNRLRSTERPCAAAEEPFAAAEKPFAAAEEPFAAAEEPFAAAEGPFAAAEEPFAAAEGPFAVR